MGITELPEDSAVILVGVVDIRSTSRDGMNNADELS